MGILKRGQISFEYLILMGFVTLVISLLLGIAFYYTDSVNDRVISSQISNFANKIISTSEYIHSAGEPSKSTITLYLPEGVEELNITENTLLISFRTSNGVNRIGFPSDINITGMIETSPGVKKVEIYALNGEVAINQI